MTRELIELEDARDLMVLAAAVFERWDGRLARVAESLPDPIYARDTDAPRNLAAAWQSTLQATLQDEIEPAILTLRQAAGWTEEPPTWRRDDS